MISHQHILKSNLYFLITEIQLPINQQTITILISQISWQNIWHMDRIFLKVTTDLPERGLAHFAITSILSTLFFRLKVPRWKGNEHESESCLRDGQMETCSLLIHFYFKTLTYSKSSHLSSNARCMYVFTCVYTHIIFPFLVLDLKLQ